MAQNLSEASAGGNTGTAVAAGELLWVPGGERIAEAPITHYLQWLRQRGHSFSGYHELWRWSADRIEEFWASLWDYFEVLSDSPYQAVLERRVMPGARWFSGARLNYAEHVLRHEA